MNSRVADLVRGGRQGALAHRGRPAVRRHGHQQDEPPAGHAARYRDCRAGGIGRAPHGLRQVSERSQGRASARTRCGSACEAHEGPLHRDNRRSSKRDRPTRTRAVRKLGTRRARMTRTESGTSSSSAGVSRHRHGVLPRGDGRPQHGHRARRHREPRVGFAYGGLSGGVTNGPHANTPLIEYSMSLYSPLAEALTAETNVDIQYQPRPLLAALALDDEAACAHRRYSTGRLPLPSGSTPRAAHLAGDRRRAPRRGVVGHRAVPADARAGAAAEQRGVTLRSGESPPSIGMAGASRVSASRPALGTRSASTATRSSSRWGHGPRRRRVVRRTAAGAPAQQIIRLQRPALRTR